MRKNTGCIAILLVVALSKAADGLITGQVAVCNTVPSNTPLSFTLTGLDGTEKNAHAVHFGSCASIYLDFTETSDTRSLWRYQVKPHDGQFYAGSLYLGTKQQQYVLIEPSSHNEGSDVLFAPRAVAVLGGALSASTSCVRTRVHVELTNDHAIRRSDTLTIEPEYARRQFFISGESADDSETVGLRVSVEHGPEFTTTITLPAAIDPTPVAFVVTGISGHSGVFRPQLLVFDEFSQPNRLRHGPALSSIAPLTTTVQTVVTVCNTVPSNDMLDIVFVDNLKKRLHGTAAYTECFVSQPMSIEVSGAQLNTTVQATMSMNGSTIFNGAISVSIVSAQNEMLVMPTSSKHSTNGSYAAKLIPITSPYPADYVLAFAGSVVNDMTTYKVTSAGVTIASGTLTSWMNPYAVVVLKDDMPGGGADFVVTVSSVSSPVETSFTVLRGKASGKRGSVVHAGIYGQQSGPYAPDWLKLGTIPEPAPLTSKTTITVCNTVPTALTTDARFVDSTGNAFDIKDVGFGECKTSEPLTLQRSPPSQVVMVATKVLLGNKVLRDQAVGMSPRSAQNYLMIVPNDNVPGGDGTFGATVRWQAPSDDTGYNMYTGISCLNGTSDVLLTQNYLANIDGRFGIGFSATLGWPAGQSTPDSYLTFTPQGGPVYSAWIAGSVHYEAFGGYALVGIQGQESGPYVPAIKAFGTTPMPQMLTYYASVTVCNSVPTEQTASVLIVDSTGTQHTLPAPLKYDQCLTTPNLTLYRTASVPSTRLMTTVMLGDSTIYHKAAAFGYASAQNYLLIVPTNNSAGTDGLYGADIQVTTSTSPEYILYLGVHAIDAEIDYSLTAGSTTIKSGRLSIASEQQMVTAELSKETSRGEAYKLVMQVVGGDESQSFSSYIPGGSSMYNKRTSVWYSGKAGTSGVFKPHFDLRGADFPRVKTNTANGNITVCNLVPAPAAIEVALTDSTDLFITRSFTVSPTYGKCTTTPTMHLDRLPNVEGVSLAAAVTVDSTTAWSGTVTVDPRTDQRYVFVVPGYSASYRLPQQSFGVELVGTGINDPNMFTFTLRNAVPGTVSTVTGLLGDDKLPSKTLALKPSNAGAPAATYSATTSTTGDYTLQLANGNDKTVFKGTVQTNVHYGQWAQAIYMGLADTGVEEYKAQMRLFGMPSLKGGALGTAVTGAGWAAVLAACWYAAWRLH